MTRSAGTALRPWDDGSNSVENACNRAHVAFEFIEKLGAPFYAFHDRDVAPGAGEKLAPRLLALFGGSSLAILVSASRTGPRYRRIR